MLAWLRAWWRALLVGFAAAAAALSPALYGPRTRTEMLRQVYFTAWQVLPGFTLFAAALALVLIKITVDAAREFGLAPFALELVFRGVVLELVPLVTALFVALRSGSAISTEVALMRVAGELGEDPYEHEFVPRIAATALALFALTVSACAVVMVLAYLAMYGTSPWGFAEYTRTVGRVFSPLILAGFTLKCLAFGVAVAVIPIAAALDATRDPKSAPVAVMGGMVRLFFALGLIEAVALAVKYV